MEALITIGLIVLVVVWLIKSVGRDKKQPPTSPVTDDPKKQKADEIVTVILPTINNDK